MEPNYDLYQRYCAKTPPQADPGNHPANYGTFSEEEQKALLYWVDHALMPDEKIGQFHSYGLKHCFEHEAFYITNGQFKGAMLLCGYTPIKVEELNWAFRYRERHRCKHYDQWVGGYVTDKVYPYSLGHFDLEFAKLLAAIPYAIISSEKEEGA